MVVAWIALNTLTIPAPCTDKVCKGCPSVSLEGSIIAVVSNNVLADKPTVGLLPLTLNKSATLAATNGVAIEVPESTANDPRGTGKVDKMLPPGAATAGLKNMSFVGP